MVAVRGVPAAFATDRVSLAGGFRRSLELCPADRTRARPPRGLDVLRWRDVRPVSAGAAARRSCGRRVLLEGADRRASLLRGPDRASGDAVARGHQDRGELVALDLP